MQEKFFKPRPQLDRNAPFRNDIDGARCVKSRLVASHRPCPLWTYILAEARQFQTAVTIRATGAPGPIKTPQLGPVGGRIVAEVFLGMMFGENSSLLSLDPNWAPVTGPDFQLKDLVAYALGRGDPVH